MTDPSRRTRTDRALYLSGFVSLLPAPDRVRLDRAVLALLDSDDDLPDREVILRAVDQVWPHEPRPANIEHVPSFFLERPAVADRPGAYALRALSSNGPTRSGVVGLREQERARAHGYEPECAKAAQWSDGTGSPSAVAAATGEALASKVASPATVRAPPL